MVAQGDQEGSIASLLELGENHYAGQVVNAGHVFGPREVPGYLGGPIRIFCEHKELIVLDIKVENFVVDEEFRQQGEVLTV